MEKSEEKIQIVAFSTNDSYETPNDFINVFLSQNPHTIIKQSRHVISFDLILPDSTGNSRVIICSLLNLNKEYTGINEVNCYILFVDLEKEDSKEKFESIFNYIKLYCEETKKIYIFGISSENKNQPIAITEKQVCEQFDSIGKKYEYRTININKKKEISEYFMKVLLYSKEHKISDDNQSEQMKDNGNSGSCNII